MARRSMLCSAALFLVLGYLHLGSTSAQDAAQVAPDGGTTGGAGAPAPASEVDYTALQPIELSVNIDGTLVTLRCETGQSLRAAAAAFAAQYGVPDSSISALVDGLVAKASAPQPPAPAAAGGDAGADDAAAAQQPPRRVLAQVPVVVNEEARTVTMYEGEETVMAARRFAVEAGLSNDEELDSVLRTLVNRLRYALGARDGLPMTIDAAATLTTVDVNTGDGTGRVLVLRVLAGEDAGSAAAGFLERTGFDVAANYESLRRMAQAKLDALAQANAAPATPPAPPALIDPSEGFALPVNFDAQDDSTKGELPLVYRYGVEPGTAARDFLVGAGLGAHPNLEAFVRDVEAAIRAQLAARGRGDGTTQQQQQAGQAAGTDGAAGSVPQLQLDVASAAPFPATVPMAVGALAFDVDVPQGAPLRAVARLFCSNQWPSLQPEFQAALDGVTTGGEATPDMCATLTGDLIVQWYTARVQAGGASATGSVNERAAATP